MVKIMQSKRQLLIFIKNRYAKLFFKYVKKFTFKKIIHYYNFFNNCEPLISKLFFNMQCKKYFYYKKFLKICKIVGLLEDKMNNLKK